MIPTPKHAIGATVYRPGVKQSPVHDTCPDCLGTMTWHAKLPSGEELDFTCPTCHRGYESTGTLPSLRAEGYIQVLTIGSVRFDTSRSEPIEYMCVETGVGSGSVYDEAKLLATREEAEGCLPKMVADYILALEERRATDRTRRIKDGPGAMAAHYRAKIRECNREIAAAERGLLREAHRKP